MSNGAHAGGLRAEEPLAKFRDNDNDAVFTVIAAGAPRSGLAEPTLGESFVVMGAGIVGLMATQLLLANGCKVLVLILTRSAALAEQLARVH